MFKLISSSFSQKGSNHIQNDDSLCVNQDEGIFIICDGVSDGGNGKLASDLISQTIQQKLAFANIDFNKREYEFTGNKRLKSMQDVMQTTFAEAQNSISDLAKNNQLYKVAATTCISTWFYGRFAVIGHIGDSRAYLFRSGKLYQLTRDHTGLDELLKMGMSMEAALKNPLARSLTRAFGQSQFNQPDLFKIEFEPNDHLFLCTDGVYGALKSHTVMNDFVQDLTHEKDMNPWIEKCTKITGDDSSMIHIQFKDDLQEDQGAFKSHDINASDRVNLVKLTPLSKYLDYVQQSHIAAICEIEKFSTGDVVIKEGDEGDCMFIVAKGKLNIDTKGKFLKENQPGDFFGEIALVKKSKRTATAIANEDTVLLSLMRKDLEEVFIKDPLIETRFYKAMLESVLDRVVDLSAKVVSTK